MRSSGRGRVSSGFEARCKLQKFCQVAAAGRAPPFRSFSRPCEQEAGNVRGDRMDAPTIDLSSDRLETVLATGEFTLGRSAGAAHTTPARSVLVVTPRSEHPPLQVVRMLEHEYSLRGDLDPAWALRPLALTSLEGRTALVFEDPGGELLIQRAGTPMDVSDVLRVGAGVAAALRQLHGRALLHQH